MMEDRKEMIKQVAETLRDKIQKRFVWMITDGLPPKDAVEEILNLFKEVEEQIRKEERESILDKIDELSNDEEFFLTPRDIRQALQEEKSSPYSLPSDAYDKYFTPPQEG